MLAKNLRSRAGQAHQISARRHYATKKLDSCLTWLQTTEKDIPLGNAFYWSWESEVPVKKLTGGNAGLEAYSDLLVRTVSNMIYLDPSQISSKAIRPRHKLYRRIAEETAEQRAVRAENRRIGKDRPADAHSMAGYFRLRSLADCVLDVLENDVPGNFIETGVWRGGACILMRGISKVAGHPDRKVYVADSFEGLPPPDVKAFPQDKNDKRYTQSDYFATSVEQVKDNFRAYDLLDNNVVFLKGWFKDTLPTLKETEKFAIIRLDGDMYESTIQALEVLYPKLSVGGYVIIDDFGAIKACREAVGDFRKKHSISSQIIEVDWTGVYWKKEE